MSNVSTNDLVVGKVDAILDLIVLFVTPCCSLYS